MSSDDVKKQIMQHQAASMGFGRARVRSRFEQVCPRSAPAASRVCPNMSLPRARRHKPSPSNQTIPQIEKLTNARSTVVRIERWRCSNLIECSMHH